MSAADFDDLAQQVYEDALADGEPWAVEAFEARQAFDEAVVRIQAAVDGAPAQAAAVAEQIRERNR